MDEPQKQKPADLAVENADLKARLAAVEIESARLGAEKAEAGAAAKRLKRARKLDPGSASMFDRPYDGR
jgi:hypothetical protein